MFKTISKIVLYTFGTQPFLLPICAATWGLAVVNLAAAVEYQDVIATRSLLVLAWFAFTINVLLLLILITNAIIITIYESSGRRN